MAEEPGTAVLDAPPSPAESAADPVAPVVPEPAANGSDTSSAAPPAAPQRETQPQRTIEPDQPRQPRRQARQPDAPADPPPAPLDDATDANDSLLNWRDLADPEYRNHPTLQKYKSVSEALKAVVNQEELLGRSITIPREGAGDVQWRNVFEKLGCPKTPGDYTVSDPDMGQDDDGNARTLAPNFLVSLLDVAHNAGLNNKQAQEFVNFAARTVLNSEQIQAGEMAVQKAQAERELFQAFGSDSATMLQKARLAMTKLGEGRYGGGAYAQRAAEKWVNSALANDVDMVAMLANLWDNVSEGTYVESAAGGGLSSRDQIDADMATAASIMNDESKSMEERVVAQKRHFALAQDLVALNEAAQRRQAGYR